MNSSFRQTITALPMKRLLILVFACLASGSLDAAESPSVVTSESTMRRLAEGVTFKGVAASKVNPSRWKVTIDGTAFYDQTPYDGLIEERTATQEFTLYLPFTLAIHAGWFTPKDNTYLPNGVRGVFRSGDSIWLGTNGVGVLEYNFVNRTWSRHDLKPTPIPGHHMMVFYADADYIFACHGAAMHAYSMRERRWIQIDRISTRNSVLGHAPESVMVPMPWDYRHFASAEYIPISQSESTRLSWPDRMTYDHASGEYVLDYNTDWKEAGVATKLRFKKHDLFKSR